MAIMTIDAGMDYFTDKSHAELIAEQQTNNLTNLTEKYGPEKAQIVIDAGKHFSTGLLQIMKNPQHSLTTAQLQDMSNGFYSAVSFANNNYDGVTRAISDLRFNGDLPAPVIQSPAEISQGISSKFGNEAQKVMDYVGQFSQAIVYYMLRIDSTNSSITPEKLLELGKNFDALATTKPDIARDKIAEFANNRSIASKTIPKIEIPNSLNQFFPEN